VVGSTNRIVVIVARSPVSQDVKFASNPYLGLKLNHVYSGAGAALGFQVYYEFGSELCRLIVVVILGLPIIIGRAGGHLRSRVRRRKVEVLFPGGSVQRNVFRERRIVFGESLQLVIIRKARIARRRKQELAKLDGT
jgi:hypothetical protein